MIISRREFLRIVAVAGVGGLAVKFGLDANAVSKWHRVQDTRVLMGTIVNLVVVSEDAETARGAIDATLTRMGALERVLSRFDPTSALSQLNQTGHVENPHPDLLNVVRLAHEVSALSGGAFDVTVKPVLDLYQRAQADGESLPSPQAIQAALKRVNYRNLIADDEAITFAEPGMGITLDGLAKGYIVDRGVAELKRLGFARVMVEAGGDLMSSATKDHDAPWKIGVQSPRPSHSGVMASFTLRDHAAATSGDYMQPFTPDFRLHHILDPRTGQSPLELASATITAPTAALADALATTVMVLGSERGMQLLATLSGVEAYLVTKGLHAIQSHGFAEG
ncbi:MAG: FAD:protein FMN transferase [Chloroflexi bacterium]|nr:FAD:protein FMN transferase [Chloroflexota bacterium]